MGDLPWLEWSSNCSVTRITCSGKNVSIDFSNQQDMKHASFWIVCFKNNNIMASKGTQF